MEANFIDWDIDDISHPWPAVSVSNNSAPRPSDQELHAAGWSSYEQFKLEVYGPSTPLESPNNSEDDQN